MLIAIWAAYNWIAPQSATNNTPTLAAAIGARTNTAQSATSRRSEHESVIEFALGNIEYLLVHEIAHLLISEKNVPIVGPIENAADYIATLALIREEPLDPAQQHRGTRFLLAAAEAFAASWRTGIAIDSEVPYWDDHSLSIQRYYQIACLLYGSNPEQFAHLPEETGLPETRANGCVAEYQRADEAVSWFLANYGRQPNDPEIAVKQIIFESPPTTMSAAIVQELKSTELLENILARLHSRFTLEKPFQLIVRTCGQAEAAWLPEQREIVICYELLDVLYLLGLSTERAN